ncbi:MAG: phosphotransferase [Actinomycetota bacterium]
MNEIQLPQGRVNAGVVRVGDTVRRPTGPWTPTIHAYLDHLERRGFAGAPRVLGTDEEGREILTFIEGEVPHDADWNPGMPNLWPEHLRGGETLRAAGAMLRALHNASAGFVPIDPVWREHGTPMRPDEIVTHGDVGQHNTVYRDGMAVAFIDWDGAMPNLPILEFGKAAWSFVPLGEDRVNRNGGWPTAEEMVERLVVFCRAYGETRRSVIRWALQHSRQRGVEKLRYWKLNAAEAAEALDVIARDLRWFSEHEDTITRALD